MSRSGEVAVVLKQSMYGRKWFYAASMLWLLSAGCSKDKTAGSPCIDSAVACGVACNLRNPCAYGLYCSEESLCSKECTPERGCGSSQHCGDTGRCVAGPAPVVKAGTGGQSGSSGGGADKPRPAGTSGSAGRPSYDNDGGLDGDCQTANVSASRVIPNVVLVIDQSGSMTQMFGTTGSRWDVLRDFLLRDDGLIATFENQVKFGLAMYTAVSNPDPNDATMQCPMVTSVAPMATNLAAIRSVYSAARPIGETPTGDSIDKIVDGLAKPDLDKDIETTVLILATDGEPDRCEELNPQNGQAEAVAAVKRAHEMGIDTFIISVGNEVSKMHQQDVANAGLGRDASNPAPYWTAGDDKTLRDALTQIIGAQVSCDVKLEGTLTGGNACDGTVELNSQKLACNGTDGWVLLADGMHIRLQGKACADFKQLRTAKVFARFPCSVPVLF